MYNTFILESDYTYSHEKIKQMKMLLHECVEKMVRGFLSFSIEDIHAFSDYLNARDNILIHAEVRPFEDIAYLEVGLVAKFQILFVIGNFNLDIWQKFVFEVLWECFIFEFTSKIKFANMSYVIGRISERYYHD